MVVQVTGLDHAVLCVADVEVAVRWYDEELGLSAERLEEWRRGEVPFVSLRVDGTTLIDLIERAPDGTNVDHLAFVTDRAGFDQFCERHRADIEMGPRPLFGARGVGDGAYVRDPDGHRIEVRTYE